MGEIKKIQGPPEIAPEPSPSITPEMLKDVLEILESKGMIHYTATGAYIPTESGWKLLMELKSVREEIFGHGHPEIKASDNSTIRITKGLDIDDATIAVNVDKACKDLSEDFKAAIKSARKVEVKIEVEGEGEVFVAYGSPALKLTSKEEIVIRKDSLVDGKTVAILSDKSANELKQSLIEKLKNSQTRVKISLEIKQ
ncbi:MAG: DUF371 domain-containing protein [Candidatus Aenigmatarchaeota archaeon]